MEKNSFSGVAGTGRAAVRRASTLAAIRPSGSMAYGFDAVALAADPVPDVAFPAVRSLV